MLWTASFLRAAARGLLSILVTVTLYAGSATAGSVDALESAWSCAKTAAKGYITANIELVKKADALAEASAHGSLCLAVQGGNAAPYAIALGALSAIKIASPDSLPDGQCFPTVQQTLARPVALGLSAAIPIDDIKQSLISLAESDVSSQALWNLLETSPAGPYVMQFECACTAIEAGVTLADMSAITSAIKAVSQECGGFLDEAGLGFLNDAGDAVIDGVTQFGEAGYAEAAGAYEKYVLGEEEREPDEIVYQRYFGTLVYWFAEQKAVLPNWSYLKASGPGGLGYEETWDNCFDYFDHHRVSEDGSKKTCDAFGARFLGEVETQSQRLLEFAALRDAVFPYLSKQVAADWAFRLPLRQTGVLLGAEDDAQFVSHFKEWTGADAMAQAFNGMFGSSGSKPSIQQPWICPDATGVTRTAREALATTAESKEQAVEIAYAGIVPQLSERVNLVWAQSAKEVFLYYLAKLSPAEPFSGRYNCPGGALEAACVKRLNFKFGAEETCYAGIYFAHAEAPNRDAMDNWLGEREPACAEKLKAVTERANWLADYELIDPAADVALYCEAVKKDRKARAECQQALVDVANDCMAIGIEKGQGDQKILDCYAKGAGQIRQAHLDERIDPNETVAPDEPIEVPDDLLAPLNGPGTKLPQRQDGRGSPERRVEVAPEPEVVIDEPVVRPQRLPNRPVCPERLKRGEVLPEGCPNPSRQ